MSNNGELYNKVKQVRYIPSFECKYLGPTNSRGSRVKLKFSHWAEYGENFSVTKSYKYEFDSAVETGVWYLLQAGFTVISYTSSADSYQILVDWDPDNLQNLLENLKKI